MIAKRKYTCRKSENTDFTTDHVVARLRQRLQDARARGFKVRMEVLEDEQASWCVIAGVLTLFVDLSQTAAEQLRQVEETLNGYQSGLSQNTDQKVSLGLPQDDLGKRAA